MRSNLCSSVTQCHYYCSVTKPCQTLCDPMDCSTSDFPVLHHLPEFAQTHVHWVGDAIQPPHPLSSTFPPAFNFPSIRVFSRGSIFHKGGQSIGFSASASVLRMNIQGWSFHVRNSMVSSSSHVHMYLGKLYFSLNIFDLNFHIYIINLENSKANARKDSSVHNMWKHI